MKTFRIAVVPGDGIGPEIVPAALKVVEALGEKMGFQLKKEFFPWGAGNYLKHGEFMPANGLEILKPFDAIFFGSVGLPEVDDTLPAKDYTFKVRTGFQQYVNYRPVRTYPGFHGPLKEKKNIDFVVVRENTEGEFVQVGNQVMPDTANGARNRLTNGADNLDTASDTTSTHQRENLLESLPKQQDTSSDQNCMQTALNTYLGDVGTDLRKQFLTLTPFSSKLITVPHAASPTTRNILNR